MGHGKSVKFICSFKAVFNAEILKCLWANGRNINTLCLSDYKQLGFFGIDIKTKLCRNLINIKNNPDITNHV